MDLEQIQRQRNTLEAKANKKLEDALNDMRGDISDANEMVTKKISNRGSQESSPLPNQPQEIERPIEAPKPLPIAAKHLIYFSYPMEGYDAPPAWTVPLSNILLWDTSFTTHG